MMARKQKKVRKQDILDDGRTISNMNVEGMRWYEPGLPDAQEKPEATPIVLTKKERSAILRAAAGFALKLALIVIGVFFVIILLLRIFWMR